MTALFSKPHLLTDLPQGRASTLLQVFLAKKEAAGRSPATTANYAYSIQRFLAAPTTPADPKEWDDVHVDLWLLSLRQAGQKPASIAHHRRQVLVFIRFLAIRGECPDFSKRVESVTVPETSHRTLTQEQFNLLLLQAQVGLHAIRDSAILWTLWSTGMRRSELAALDYEHLRLSDGAVLVPAAAAKTRVERRALIVPPARAAILEWLLKRGDQPGPLWLSSGHRLTSDAIRQIIFHLGQRAKVRVSSHDFRRGFAARMLAAGLDPVHTARLGGWESLEMMTHYADATATDAALKAARRLA